MAENPTSYIIFFVQKLRNWNRTTRNENSDEECQRADLIFHLQRTEWLLRAAFLKLGIQYERLPCHLATSLWRRVFSFLTELYTVGRTERKPKSPVVGFIVGVTKSCPWSPPNITPPQRRPMKPSQYVYTRRALFKRLHQHLITFAPFFLC